MGELDGITIFKIGGDPYTKEDLMNMEPVCLRALLRERVHHTIEVEIYRAAEASRHRDASRRGARA